ncbi:unnamed protein product, partial [Adineta ricciae]
MKYLLFAISILQIVHCQKLYELLNSVKFFNEGWISNSDAYEYQYEYAYYTEPENVTRQRFSWMELYSRPYLYKRNPDQPLQCDPNPVLTKTDLPGADFLSIIPSAMLIHLNVTSYAVVMHHVLHGPMHQLLRPISTIVDK